MNKIFNELFFVLYFLTFQEYYQEENKCFCTKPTFSLQLFAGSVVGTGALTFLTGCGLGLLIGLLVMKSKQAKPQVPNINTSSQEEETSPVTGPVYEEVQFERFTW